MTNREAEIEARKLLALVGGDAETPEEKDAAWNELERRCAELRVARQERDEAVTRSFELCNEGWQKRWEAEVEPLRQEAETLRAERDAMSEALREWAAARDRTSSCREEFGWNEMGAEACAEFSDLEDEAAERLAALAVTATAEEASDA